jgi:hypothetical protein
MSTKPQKLGLFTAKLTKRAKKDKIKTLINPEIKKHPAIITRGAFYAKPLKSIKIQGAVNGTKRPKLREQIRHIDADGSRQ